MQKGMYLFVLLTFTAFESWAQEAVKDFIHLAKKESPLIAGILSSRPEPTYTAWMSNRDTREAIIRYCDKAVDGVKTVSIDYQGFKKTITKMIDSNRGTKDNPFKDSAFVHDNHWLNEQPDTKRKNTKYYYICYMTDTITIGIDTTLKQKEDFEATGNRIMLSFIQPLISILLLDQYVLDEKGIAMDLSILQKHYTVQYLHNIYEYKLNNSLLNIPEAMQTRNIKLIEERLGIIESKNFVLYQSPAVKNKAIKSVELFMDNDVFMLVGDNQDREYTGGGALTVSTDYFKFRFFDWDWLFHPKLYQGNKTSAIEKAKDSMGLSRRKVLTYQSLKLGMHFYTPFIRYRDNFALADSMYKIDRPFGSYIYVERSKYRLWSSGIFRNKGNFQIGMIGSSAGRNIQALLHRDAVTTSQKVYGWHNQIANGGRWLIQLNHTVDVMLYSNTNRSPSVFRPDKLNKRRGQYYGFNMYNSTELFWGGYYTAAGTGVFFSLLDFTKQSGQNMIAPFRKSVFEFGINVETGFRYRYVIHNSMLEGFGYWCTFIDDKFDDEPLNPYTLSKSSINRHVGLWETRINLRWRKMVFYYNLVIQTKEYNLPTYDYDVLNIDTMVKENDRDYIKNKVIPELKNFDKSKIYGYGKLGFVWIVD